MADPNDIYDRMTPSGVPLDSVGAPIGSPGSDPNSAGRAAVAAATEAARAADARAGVHGDITVAANSQADEWNAKFLPGGENYSLTASQWNDENPAPIIDRRGRQIDRTPFRDAREMARNYRDTTRDVVGNTLAAHKDISSADFVRKLSGLDSTHPDYPTQFADLVATHPTAGGKLVDQVIEHQQGRRENFQKAVEKGGAAEYGSNDTPTPAFRSYVKTFATTKDPVQAKAAAERVVKEELALDTAAKNGLLTDADFPKWDDRWRFSAADSVRPKIYNRDGTTNYAEAKKLINAREGAGGGLKGQQSIVKEEDASIREFGKQLADMDETNPNYTKLHDLWQASLNDRSRRLREAAAQHTPGAAPAPVPAGTPAASAPAGGTPAPAANLPATRIQNGVVYTLQPDGSYK